MKRRDNKLMVIFTLLISGFIALSFSLSKAEEIKQFTIRANKNKFFPKKITVNKGDKVIIKATAIDRDHGFGIKAYNIKKLLPKGEEITIEFVADKEGEFTIRCTKWCGFGHIFMSGEFIVK